MQRAYRRLAARQCKHALCKQGANRIWHRIDSPKASRSKLGAYPHDARSNKAKARLTSAAGGWQASEPAGGACQVRLATRAANKRCEQRKKCRLKAQHAPTRRRRPRVSVCLGAGGKLGSSRQGNAEPSHGRRGRVMSGRKRRASAADKADKSDKGAAERARRADPGRRLPSGG